MHQPLTIWTVVKGDTKVAFTEKHLPEDVRAAVLNAYIKAGYRVSEVHTDTQGNKSVRRLTKV